MSCFIFFLNNLDNNTPIYDIQNNNFFSFFIFAYVRFLLVCVLKWLSDLSFFLNLLKWRVLSDCWFRLNWLLKNLLSLYWLLLLSSSSRVRLHLIFCIITLNKTIFLILNISFMIKNLFFNIEVSLVKNNIALWYSSKRDNSFFISFKWTLKTLTF